MAAVVIDSGPIDAEDRPQDIPRSRWADLVQTRRTFLEIRLPHDCRILVRFRQEAELMYEALGFTSADELVRAGYGFEPGEINAAVDWLERNRPDKAIGLADVLGKHGTNQHTRGVSNTKSRPISRVPGQAYWLARLERDATGSMVVAAELERVQTGQSSAHAAAVRLGWRSPRHCKSCRCFE